MDKKALNTKELSDEELQEVQGGSNDFGQVGDRYFSYTGTGDNDRDRKYLCPRCGRPVHYGSWGRYYCDPCDEGWFSVGDLKLNLNSGVWEEISLFEYIMLQKASR